MRELICRPIGYFRTAFVSKYDLPRQPSGLGRGRIILNPHENFEQALEGLGGFERIWLLFWLDKSDGWKPKVRTPRGEEKQGLFATRSPYRPNPIGLSCVKLISIERREIEVEGHDLLDATPILDIKPYVEYADSFSNVQQGWLEEFRYEKKYEVTWSMTALDQRAYLQERGWLLFNDALFYPLTHYKGPSSYNRLRLLGDNKVELAYKTWRFLALKREDSFHILTINSGYDRETLLGLKSSAWGDVEDHKKYISHFENKLISHESLSY